MPAYNETDRTTWTLSDGVLIIDGQGEAKAPYYNGYAGDGLIEGNTYIETAIVTDQVTSIDSSLLKRLPNLKSVIILNNETKCMHLVSDCPYLTTVIVGADLQDNALAMDADSYDTVKRTTGRATGGPATAVITQPLPLKNLLVLSSDWGDLQELADKAKMYIAEMNLPQFALDLLPANLGGSTPAVSIPPAEPVIVSPWAQDSVEKAKELDLLPNGVYERFGRDFTQNITRYQFASMAVKMYETITNDIYTSTFPAYLDPAVDKYATLHSLRFPDCSGDYQVDDIMSKAYNLGIINGYGTPSPVFEINNDGTVSDYIDYYNVNVGPHDLITREQAASMLIRLSDALGMSVPFTDNIPPFTDSISDWAYDDVARISNANIMTGTSDTTFDAKAGFTIEQSIVSLIRLEMYVR